MNSTTIAVDIAKSVFELAVSEEPGTVARRERLSRLAFERFLAATPPATILLEACGMAHHWGRVAGRAGHRPILVPPHVVRPYVTRNKTDRADAKALLEAFRNEEIRPVPVKTPAQQSIAALHRVRSAWIGTRTARINTVRGLLREFGITIALGAEKVAPRVGAILEDAENSLPDPMRAIVAEAVGEIRELTERIRRVERMLVALGKETPVVARLETIPGIGPLTATALVALVGDARRFPSGRHLASYIGLTPKEHSSGLQRRLGAISKRGDEYLRMLLIHGARAVLVAAKSKTTLDRLRFWALDRERARGHNRAATAVAAKMARIAWAVWTKGVDYESRPAAEV